MTTIKSYTDIEQSKKLAKILPIESADMGWYYTLNPDAARNQMWAGTNAKNADIPCWSLAAMLKVLHNYTLQTNTDGKVFVIYENEETVIGTEDYDNPIDACYEMILKLKENNLL